MRMLYALTAVPALAVLAAAALLARDTCRHRSSFAASTTTADVATTRASLMNAVPVGTPIDAALIALQEQGLSCAMSAPPLANLTWPVVVCATPPGVGGATLKIDVAARHRVVADIGVENLSCSSRADIIDPAPVPVDCDLSSGRRLAIEAQRKAGAGSLLADVLSAAAPPPSARR